jgi:tRNA(Ile)-lysidine synthase
MRSAAVQNTGPGPLQKFRPPARGTKILVAVSGGVDSMALLHLLDELSAERRWELTVAHFNHCLRGRASDADEAFVRKTAAKMKLPFVSKRADVKKFAKESRLSIEMAARKLRHEFFAGVARKCKIKTITLAHHADDQVELFFLRLLRGSGGGGLAGMKGSSPSPADKTISLIRPLLNLSKAELEQYARENKVRFREDATNFSSDFLRNKIRNELLPLLRKQYQPALNKMVLRLMEIIEAESDFAEDVARTWLGRKERDFDILPPAIQRQILRLQLVALGITADFDLIESLRRSANRAVSVFSSLSVSRDEKGNVSLNDRQAPKFNAHELALEPNKPGVAVFEGAKFKWQFKVGRKAQGRFIRPAQKSGTEFFDADKMGDKIVLRHWHAGDRFQPIGLKAPVKLQDLFTNQKIPRVQRHKLVVAEMGGKIFWVEGLRISEQFKLTPQTKRQLIWRWQR